MKNYGTVTLEGGHWIIEAQPHVSLRLKRVFGKADRFEVGKIKLSNTLENCRDLEWFLQRYPMTVFPADKLTSSATLHVENETLISKLLASVSSSLNFPMALPPRDYQALAAEICLRSGGLLVADDVGLGKSVVAIAAFVRPEVQPVLVVCPAHLPRQWRRDFIAKFAPHLKVHILKKGTPYDLRGADGALPDVIITSYHKLTGWAETLAPIIKMIIWDEVQELRHVDSQKYIAAQYLANRAAIRMGLSATPIYNYGNEMFNVMNCICPGALGEREEFNREWCSVGMLTQPKAFGQYLRDTGMMVRRTREEVGRELPACTVMIQPVESDSDYLEHLDCAELAKTILASGEAYRGQKMQASSEFDMRMRQATGIAKAPYVAAFAKLFLERGEPVVIYAWHREVYAILQKQLIEYLPVLYTGSESATQKDMTKELFLTGKSDCLLISLRSGQGLDGLQERCSTVLFAELDWSPGVHEQNIGRVFRDGQKRPVFAYYLLSNSGSDPVISDTLGLKTQQIEGIRNPKQELIQKLAIDPDHIKKLARDYLNRKGIPIVKETIAPAPNLLFT